MQRRCRWPPRDPPTPGAHPRRTRASRTRSAAKHRPREPSGQSRRGHLALASAAPGGPARVADRRDPERGHSSRSPGRRRPDRGGRASLSLPAATRSLRIDAHTVAPALLGVTRAATRLGRGGRRAPAHLVAVDDVRATWGRGQRAPVHGGVSEVCGVPRDGLAVHASAAAREADVPADTRLPVCSWTAAASRARRRSHAEWRSPAGGRGVPPGATRATPRRGGGP